MFKGTDLRSLLLITAAIFLGLVFALGAAGFEQYFVTPSLEQGDIAVNALQVDNAKHFREIYGNYSRFEFNHPGPAFFYVYAAGEWLFHDLLQVAPAPANAQLFASMCLQSAFFALALALLSTQLTWRALLPLALLAAALHFGPLRDPFMSIWPPHVLLMPFLCFLTACASVASGRIDHLPVAVLAGGFLFHGHVAQILFVSSLGGLAAALAAWRLRRANPACPWRELAAAHRPMFLFCAGGGFLFLLPLLIDLFTGWSRSNVATILVRFYANTSDSKTALQSFFYFLSFATTARNQDEIFTVPGPQMYDFFSANAGRIGAWGALFLLPPILAFIWRARMAADERRFLAAAYGLLAVSAGAGMLWGMAQAGSMFHFNGYFFYGIYFFGLLLAAALLARVMECIRIPYFLPVLCAITAVLFTWSFRLPRLSEEASGILIKKGVEAALRADGSQNPKLLVFEHAVWPAVASVALDLQRRKLGFYTAPRWGFMFGARHKMTELGGIPEDRASVWWITKPGEGGIPIAPDLSIFLTPAPIHPEADEIRFQGGDNGFRYVISGVNAGNIDYTWTDLPRLALLFAPQPAEHDVRIVFDAGSAQLTAGGASGQPAVIHFNGELIGRVTAGERSQIAVTVPRALWNDRPHSKLELTFPSAVPHRASRRPRYQWWTAWRLWNIRFEPAS